MFSLAPPRISLPCFKKVENNWRTRKCRACLLTMLTLTGANPLRCLCSPFPGSRFFLFSARTNLYPHASSFSIWSWGCSFLAVRPSSKSLPSPPKLYEAMTSQMRNVQSAWGITLMARKFAFCNAPIRFTTNASTRTSCLLWFTMEVYLCVCPMFAVSLGLENRILTNAAIGAVFSLLSSLCLEQVART
jgi:hypothetical protein